MSLEEGTGQKNHYWNYFLAIESDLERVSRYIEFNEDNYEVYSIELAHILFAASSEVEVIAKDICKLKKKKLPKFTTIKHWEKAINSLYPELCKESVYISKHNINVLTPFEKFETDQVPEWWLSYNKVKHNRIASFNDANLKNALISVASLFVINLYYQAAFSGKSPDSSRKRLTDSLSPQAQLFRYHEKYYQDHPISVLND